ncbi:hypothetical protein ACFL48_02720 [Pseudomonadota bacterium]
MILFIIMFLFLWVGYFAFKYGICSQNYSRRPSLLEVWSYKITTSDSNYRNARAVKFGSAFMLLFCVLGAIATKDSDWFSKQALIDAIKPFLILILTINILSRYVLYKEKHLDDKEFPYHYGWYWSAATHEMYYALKRVGLFVKGLDFISMTLNVTNVIFIGTVGYSLFIFSQNSHGFVESILWLFGK